jgi:phosphinothricin acetyltransferase
LTETTIRHAEPGRDAAACAAIYAPHVEEGVTSFEERAPDGAEMEGRITRLITAHPWIVAEVEGQVVAFAYVCRHRSRAAYRWSVDVSVYVAAAHQRQGHGRRLYEALFEELRERHFHVACAGITLPNEASVALHEGLGFEPVGVYREIGWKAGAWRDVGWWQLRLSPAGDAPAAEPG